MTDESTAATSLTTGLAAAGDGGVAPGVQAAPDDAPAYDVTTPGGVLRGSIEGDLVRFRGVRYGRAERFGVVAAEQPWQGIRSARTDGPMCPQPTFGMALLALPKPVPPMAEDCFFLNVTAPVDATRQGGAAKPVMVWIHGGAYVNGSGSGHIYDPARLVRDGDVIVVGINYRLGVFGYAPIEGVAEANLGVRDQLAALDWVVQNIAAFGGDPANITLFGQSAGADSIVQLLAMPEADALFHRAILQSAPLGLDEGRETIAPQLGAKVVRHLRREYGVDPEQASTDQLLDAQEASLTGLAGDRLTVGMPYAPTPGVWPVAPKRERAERRARRARSVSLLVGYTRDDFSPFIEQVSALKRARQSPLLRPATQPLNQALTRRVFGAPSLALAAEFAAAGSTVFTYRFDWRPKGTPWGACHCIDLPFFWADEEFWRGSPMLAGTDWGRIDTYGRELRQAWAQFARTGDPGLAGWCAYTEKSPIGAHLDLR